MQKAAEYRWADSWSDRPDPALTMAHSSVVVTDAGEVVTGAAAAPALVFRAPDGRIVREAPVAGAAELHGLRLVEEAAGPLLWIADPAMKLHGGSAELDTRLGRRGRVFQVGLDGLAVRELEDPPVAGEYRPTAVAVDERRHGGSGDVWVADGYGSDGVHRYDEGGRHLGCLDDASAPPLREPHDAIVDRRAERPQLLVADRHNARIQRYDLEGRFLGLYGQGELVAPTQMVVVGEHLLVTDLLAGRVTILDPEGGLVGHLFAGREPVSWDDDLSVWPNDRDDDGLVAAFSLPPHELRAPHGIGLGADGTVYVSEFAIGGRITVLEPL